MTKLSKQDPNDKRLKKMLFIMMKHNIQIFGGSPFCKLQVHHNT